MEAPPVPPLQAESSEAQLERLHQLLAALQNQIGFKELRKEPDAEVALLRDQLTRVESRINEIEARIFN
jgi:transcription elongation GreA/GreB family factor